MLRTFKPDYIIRLPKISRSLFIPTEIIFDERTMDNVNDVIETQISYDELPKSFISIDKHPTSTNLLCWFCDRSFSKRPIFVSPNIKELEGEIEYETHGNFCSFNCAYSWIDANYSGLINEKLKIRLHQICRIFTKHPNVIIHPAFPKTIMKKYGGDVDIEKYNELMSGINPERIVFTPIIPERQRVQQTMWELE